MCPMTPPAGQPELDTLLVASGDITLTDLAICWSCDRITGRHRKPATHWWQTRLGYWIGLCNRCCAIWRRGARGGTDLQPLRLSSHRPDWERAA